MLFFDKHNNKTNQQQQTKSVLHYGIKAGLCCIKVSDRGVAYSKGGAYSLKLILDLSLLIQMIL